MAKENQTYPSMDAWATTTFIAYKKSEWNIASSKKVAGSYSNVDRSWISGPLPDVSWSIFSLPLQKIKQENRMMKGIHVSSLMRFNRRNTKEKNIWLHKIFRIKWNTYYAHVNKSSSVFRISPNSIHVNANKPMPSPGLPCKNTTGALLIFPAANGQTNEQWEAAIQCLQNCFTISLIPRAKLSKIIEFLHDQLDDNPLLIPYDHKWPVLIIINYYPLSSMISHDQRTIEYQLSIANHCWPLSTMNKSSTAHQIPIIKHY